MRHPQSRIRDTQQISRGKFDRLPYATAEFTTSVLDGYALRCQWPARPTPYASDPVLVHRLVCLLHASSGPHLAMTPLRFATTSPPSGCRGDFHPRAVDHARHTIKTPVASTTGFTSLCLQGPILPNPSVPEGAGGDDVPECACGDEDDLFTIPATVQKSTFLSA